MTPVRLAAAAAIALALSGCSSWNPLVAMGIKSEPANKPTALAPITASVTPKASSIASERSQPGVSETAGTGPSLSSASRGVRLSSRDQPSASTS